MFGVRTPPSSSLQKIKPQERHKEGLTTYASSLAHLVSSVQIFHPICPYFWSPPVALTGPLLAFHNSSNIREAPAIAFARLRQNWALRGMNSLQACKRVLCRLGHETKSSPPLESLPIVDCVSNVREHQTRPRPAF